MPAPLLYLEVDPPRELAGVVLAYWAFEVRPGAPASHTLWPDAGISVVCGMHQGDATGLSPKEYARIRRLRQTLGRVIEERENIIAFA